MDNSSLFEEMIDFISFFLYKRKKAASSHHNFAYENNKEVWLRDLKLRLSKNSIQTCLNDVEREQFI